MCPGDVGCQSASTDGGGAGLTMVGKSRETSGWCRVPTGRALRGVCGCQRVMGTRGRWLSPSQSSGLHGGGDGKGWLKAEHWVMQHNGADGSASNPRLQEKLDRGQQVPVAAALLIPIRGGKEIPKIALHAWDVKAAHGDHGPCAMEPPWLAGPPGQAAPHSPPPSQVPGQHRSCGDCQGPRLAPA